MGDTRRRGRGVRNGPAGAAEQTRRRTDISITDFDKCYIFDGKTVKNWENGGFIKEMQPVPEIRFRRTTANLQHRKSKLAKKDGKCGAAPEADEDFCQKISEVCKK
ncbi:MAG: hypothetical protein LUC48_01650 [Clostridiales bacterium]|nr:hypothetical protein [Clostridiales bacterium]